MLTPSFPTLRRPLGSPVCLARFPAAQLWLEDHLRSPTLPLLKLPSTPRLRRDKTARQESYDVTSRRRCEPITHFCSTRERIRLRFGCSHYASGTTETQPV